MLTLAAILLQFISLSLLFRLLLLFPRKKKLLKMFEKFLLSNVHEIIEERSAQHTKAKGKDENCLFH